MSHHLSFADYARNVDADTSGLDTEADDRLYRLWSDEQYSVGVLDYLRRARAATTVAERRRLMALACELD